MRVAIPHTLGREEVRRRLRSRGHEIADHIPGGMAEVQTDWPSEDCMTIAVSALGQRMLGAIEVGDSEIVVAFDLPPALSFIEPVVEGAVRKQGQKLLAPPSE